LCSSSVINLRRAKTKRAKKQRQPIEMNKENQYRKNGANQEYDEISAQKLCAGTMSMCETRHTGREGFTLRYQ